MTIEMPRGLPFSVHTFTPASKRKRHHFLTHAHRDHIVGISTHSPFPIYATRLTKSLLLQYYPQLDESLFVGIETEQTLVIDDPDGAFTVTAFDANHCPGAVMFLFEGHFGTVLHTGDCRLTPECLQNLPEKYIVKKGKAPRCQLDYVFLDCTFGKFSQKLPSKHSAIRQVISCIWKHPDADVVYLACDLLGQEEILEVISKSFGSKIFVDEVSNPHCFQSLKLIVPAIVSEDPSTRFQIFDGFPKLYERASAKVREAQANSQPEPLIIRPSAQWYACDEDNSETLSQRKLKFTEAVRDQFGVWHVCYSMHSSREELEWALQLLAPKHVISTTPTCRATDLDYVRKHCFSRITSDDPLWKLLDISMETSVISDAANKGQVSAFLLEAPTQTSVEYKSQPTEGSSCPSEILSLYPPAERQPVTLFGRARHSLGNSSFSCEKGKAEFMKDDLPEIMVNKTEEELSSQEFNGAVNSENNFKKEEEITAVQCTKLLIKEDYKSSFRSQVGSSCEEKTTIGSTKDDPQQVNKKEQLSSMEVGAEVNCVKGFEKVETDVTAVQFGKLVEKEYSSSFHSPVGSSKNYNEGLRNLYRSKNVPVPRPLPSLVELMNANKRAKRLFELYF